MGQLPRRDAAARRAGPAAGRRAGTGRGPTASAPPSPLLMPPPLLAPRPRLPPATAGGHLGVQGAPAGGRVRGGRLPVRGRRGHQQWHGQPGVRHGERSVGPVEAWERCGADVGVGAWTDSPVCDTVSAGLQKRESVSVGAGRRRPPSPRAASPTPFSLTHQQCCLPTTLTHRTLTCPPTRPLRWTAPRTAGAWWLGCLVRGGGRDACVMGGSGAAPDPPACQPVQCGAADRQPEAARPGAAGWGSALCCVVDGTVICCRPADACDLICQCDLIC